MAENRRPSRSGVAHMGVGQPRAHDNNNYEYDQPQSQYTNNQGYAMNLYGKRDGAYRAGSWALQDDDEEEGEEGDSRGRSRQDNDDHEDQEEEEEENPFDLSSRNNTRRGHQQSLTSTTPLTTYTPYTEPPTNSTTNAFPALAGVSRRINFTTLASSSRANHGHSAVPLPEDSTTLAVMKKSLMPPPATTKKQQQKKKRITARAGSLSSSSSPTAVADPDDDFVDGGKGGKGVFNLKPTPAEAAAAALSRSTKQTKALKTRSRTGRIVRGAQTTVEHEMEKELELELEREVQLEVRKEIGMLGVPTPIAPEQVSGIETEMSPATALVVDTARLQLISPPPEEMLREKRRNAAQTTPSAPPPNSSFIPHISIVGSTTPVTPHPNTNISSNLANSTSNHSPNYSPNGTATKRKRTAAAQRQRQARNEETNTSLDVNREADTSYTPAGIPGQPTNQGQSSSSSRNASRQSRHHDEDEQREELYPDPEATPNPKPRKMGRVQRGDADASPTKSVSKSTSKSASKSAAHAHPNSSANPRSRNVFANLNSDIPSSSSRFDMHVPSSSRLEMLLDESMDLDSDLLVGDSDLLRASGEDEDDAEDEEEDVVMASPTKTRMSTHTPRTPAPKTPSRSKSAKTPNSRTSRGRAPSPSPGRSRVRSVGSEHGDNEEDDETATPKAPVPRKSAATSATTPRTARRTNAEATTSSRKTATHPKAAPKPKSISRKGKGKARARDESPLADTTTDDDALENQDEEEEEALALESDSGASDTSADLELSRRRTDDDEEVSTTPRRNPRKMVLKSPHANKADADWVPDVVVRVRERSVSRADGLEDREEEEEEGDALPELPSPSALASAVKNVKASRKRSATPIPPYEPPPDVFTPPRVVYVQPPQSVRKTPAAKTPKTQSATGRKKKLDLKITPPHKVKIKTETPHSTMKSARKGKYPAYIDLTLATPMDPPSPTDDPLLLSGPIGPPIGSSSPVKGGRWSRFNASNAGVGEIPPWTPGYRHRLDAMREEVEDEDEDRQDRYQNLEEEPAPIPIAEEEDHDGDDGVLPPSSEMDFDFGSGFASESGRSESPESRARPVSAPVGGLDEDDVHEEQGEMGEESHRHNQEDEGEDEDPRFDLPSDRTDAQLPLSSPTLMALERSVERSSRRSVDVSTSVAGSPEHGVDASTRQSLSPAAPSAAASPRHGPSRSSSVSSLEESSVSPSPVEEVEVEVPLSEDVVEEMEETEEEEEGRVEIELDVPEEAPEEAEMDEEPVWRRSQHEEGIEGSEQGLEIDVDAEQDRRESSHDYHDYQQDLHQQQDRDHVEPQDQDDDVLTPSSSPPRIHLLRPSSPFAFGVEEGGVVEVDWASPQRRYGLAYGYPHGSVYVPGVDARVGVREQQERGRDDLQQGFSAGVDMELDEEVEQEVAQMELESESEEDEARAAEVEVDVESSAEEEEETPFIHNETEVDEEDEYMRADTDDQDAADAEVVEDSMLHGDPGDEEVAPLPVFDFDFQGAVAAARAGDLDEDRWSSDNDAEEGSDEGDIDDETLHTMHAQMNSAALAASAVGLSGKELAMEEGEGTWTGRWRAIRVRTMMDPPSSATRGRIERWQERRRISPVPWVGERSRSRIVEEDEEEERDRELDEEEEELSREEGEVEMSVFLDADDVDGHIDTVDADADAGLVSIASADPRAAARAAAILQEHDYDCFTELPSASTSTPAQALHDRARAAARKSLLEASGVSKTPAAFRTPSRSRAYRPSWAKTPAYTVEQDPDSPATTAITTLPALLQEAEQDVRAEQAFARTRASTPTLSLPPSPPQLQSPYDPANADADELLHLTTLRKDNYTPFAFKTPTLSTLSSDLSRSLWGNAPGAMSTPAPPPQTAPEAIPAPKISSVARGSEAEASTSQSQSSSIRVTSDSIINEKEKHFNDFHEYPAASPDHHHDHHHPSSSHSPFSTAAQGHSAKHAEVEAKEIEANQEEDAHEEFDEEEEYEYGYKYDYDSTWTGPGPRPWTRREWRLLDACFTDERIRLGKRMFPSLAASRFSAQAHETFSSSMRVSPSSRSASRGAVRRNSSLGRTKKDQEDADWDFDEGVSLLRGNPLAPVEDVDVRRVVGRFLGAASGMIPLRACEDQDEDEDEDEEDGHEDAETKVKAWGEGWDRDTLVARVEALERKQREGRVVRMRERLARRGFKRRATIGATSFNTAFNATSLNTSFNAGSKSFGAGSSNLAAPATSTSRTPSKDKGRGKERANPNPFDFSFFREQQEEEHRSTTTTGPVPQYQDEAEHEHQHQQERMSIEVPDFIPMPRGRRGAAHPRKRVVSGASSVRSTTEELAAGVESAHQPPHVDAPHTPRTTPARPTTSIATSTAFPGLSSLRTRAASASPNKTSERRSSGGGSPRYSYLMEEAIRVHLGQEERGERQEEEREEEDMDVDEHDVDEHQERRDENQEDDPEEEDDDDSSASKSGDESEPEEALPREHDELEMRTRTQTRTAADPEAASSPGLGTRVKGFLYSYLRPSSATSNLKSTSTIASTSTTTARIVSTTSVTSSSRTGSGSSMPMGPAARARAQAQAQLRVAAAGSKLNTKPTARAPTAQQTTSKPILRRGLPMQPPAVLEARTKARTRVTRPVVTPARPPPVKPPHPKDVVRLHPPAASASSSNRITSSNPIRLNATTTNGKARQIPIPIPRHLVRLNHIPPPVEKPVVDRTASVNDQPRRPRSSAGSSVKDLVGVFEEMEREAAGSRAGFTGGVGGAPAGVFAKDARAREAARKWRADARDTRPRWR